MREKCWTLSFSKITRYDFLALISSVILYNFFVQQGSNSMISFPSLPKKNQMKKKPKNKNDNNNNFVYKSPDLYMSLMMRSMGMFPIVLRKNNSSIVDGAIVRRAGNSNNKRPKRNG